MLRVIGQRSQRRGSISSKKSRWDNLIQKWDEPHKPRRFRDSRALRRARWVSAVHKHLRVCEAAWLQQLRARKVGGRQPTRPKRRLDTRIRSMDGRRRRRSRTPCDLTPNRGQCIGRPVPARGRSWSGGPWLVPVHHSCLRRALLPARRLRALPTQFPPRRDPLGLPRWRANPCADL